MLGEPQFYTLLATKCGQPAATGSLYLQKDLGYLGNGKTMESFRRQSSPVWSLSRPRLQYGGGTRISADVVGETYKFLESSYRNLIRLGFVELYSRAIYRTGGLTAYTDARTIYVKC